MAFLNRVGNVLKQAVSKHVSSQYLAPSASIFQAVRSMSTSAKLFVGGTIVVFSVMNSFPKSSFMKFRISSQASLIALMTLVYKKLFPSMEKWSKVLPS